MRFMIMIKATPGSEARVRPADSAFEEMDRYHEDMVRAGIKVLDGSGLKPSSTGWRIRFDGDKSSVVDGPFTESKELIAGYILIEATSREEALKWTRRFPASAMDGKRGEIEVRQLFRWDDAEHTAAV